MRGDAKTNDGILHPAYLLGPSALYLQVLAHVPAWSDEHTMHT